MAQPSSQTTDYNPATSDLVIEAYARLQIHPPSFTAQHMWNARSSASLLLSEWNIKDGAPNLWKVELLQIPLVQGVSAYTVPAKVVSILDYYVRQFSLTDTTDLTLCYTTTSGSRTITVTWPNNGLTAGAYIGVVVQTAIAGIILYGFYQVVGITDANNFTITATQTPTSSVTLQTGTLPVFTTTVGSAAVQVVLANHGLGVGSQFMVPVATNVGGLNLSGSYTVASYSDANTFYITAPTPAASTDSATENGGVTQLSSQAATNPPQDRVVFPLSRTEYADQPNKSAQAFPSTVWWDRAPATGGTTINFWQVPDQNGPYTLYFYAMTQIEDVVISGGTTLDIPNRFLEAFGAGLAAKLAWKYPENLVKNGLTVKDVDFAAERAWARAAGQDTENVPMFLSPGLSGYFRN